MNEPASILLGKGEKQLHLLLGFANRHGLIAGATGTGKTVSLQILAEGFSKQGVPVFMADIKGDLSGICQPSSPHPKIDERIKKIGIKDYQPDAFPTIFWDLFGEQGHPIRATVSEMGPLLLARLLQLNETQEGVLNITFKLADDQGMLLLDLKDLRSMLTFVAENSQDLTSEYGTVRKVSAGAIQRRLLVLEQQGASNFFGEPALELLDFMRVDSDGRGFINVLAADKLMQNPRVYSTFMLWLMSELFEELPEVGDQEKPRLVFFFDEAHLLFNDAPKALVEKVEQVVRLIRSKGVGVFFVTQNPLDVPVKILGQLGNRVQHALRSFTPRDQKAVRTAAETFRPNPKFDSAEAITQLEVGEALVSTLDAKGAPTMVEKALIRPPCSRIGPATDAERRTVMQRSPMMGKYDTMIDRESAYEELLKRAEKAKEAEAAQKEAEESGGGLFDWIGLGGGTGKSKGRKRQGLVEAMAKSMVRTVGRSIGRQIVRGILGAILKGR